jgi:CRISPR-associated protein Cmr2
MARHLFLVTLGPIQEFIAAARRTRDLWFGSWLLSELSRAAAQAVQRAGGTLIFPGELPNATTEANVANKILAVVSADPRELGKQVEGAVQERLMEIWQNALRQINGPIDTQAALAQIRDLPEVYWAAVELPDAAGYAQARRRVEALIAARKATRDFAPVTWGATAPKSSIDGQRESVIPETAYPHGLNDPQRQTKIDALYQNYRAGPAERLSGVDLLKRHGQPGNATLAFASTSDVAVRPLLHRLDALDKEKVRQAWKDYISRLKTLAGNRLEEERTGRASHWLLGHYDGGLLIESGLNEVFDDIGAGQQAGKALAAFYQTVGVDRPDPYYAILVADGDRMGATIDHQTSIEAHRELSRRQSRFAQAALQIVQQHDGSLVYAGGDDVLAFLPLHTLLQCACALHRRFGEIINPPDEQLKLTDERGQAPTLSVGIAIVHHLEPLSDALALARAAERTAKAVKDKNALALTLSKRSGADVTVAGTWGTIEQRLWRFSLLHRLDQLPDGAAFQLRDLAERLQPRGANTAPPAAAVLAEAKRIIGRKQPQRGRASQVDASVQALLGQQLTPPSAPTSAPQDGLAALRQVRALADELIVARVLAAAADLAALPQEELQPCQPGSSSPAIR